MLIAIKGLGSNLLLQLGVDHQTTSRVLTKLKSDVITSPALQSIQSCNDFRALKRLPKFALIMDLVTEKVIMIIGQLDKATEKFDFVSKYDEKFDS